ncbi:phosphodiester glycosidase family protein [Glaciecola sp. SC05]|uniref:phosphodiester glycosidase family protein n=1 Tax=Glaciecola sp. SC05 TaxID=1987355 RepID=UPI003528B13C
MLKSVQLTLTVFLICLSFSSNSKFADESSALPRLKIGSLESEQKVIHNRLGRGLSHYQVTIVTDTSEYALLSEFLTPENAQRLLSKIKHDTTSDDLENLLNAESLLSTAQVMILETEGIEDQVLNNQKTNRVYIKGISSKVDTESFQQRLVQAGVEMSVIDVSSRQYTPGNFNISVLKLNLAEFQGEIFSVLAQDKIKGLETVSKIAVAHNASAATNGGYFAYKEEQGTPGDLAGISVISGTIVSESVIGRPALLIQNSPSVQVKILENVVSEIKLSIDDNSFHVDGINRKLGYQFNCGHMDGGVLVRASHDVVCRNDNEIVIYDEHFGDVSPDMFTDSLTFLLTEQGTVSFEPMPQSKFTVPNGQYLIATSGQKKELLAKHIKSATKARITKHLFNDKNPVAMGQDVFLINGGPTLLVGGIRQESNWANQGWDPFGSKVGSESADIRDGKNPSTDVERNDRIAFFDAWVNQRHPRTAVGIDESGNFYAVVVYGRNPQISIGASISEMADIMSSLGATDAINLDGGGSSVMVLNNKLTGLPSDEKGERKVADSLIFKVSKEGRE